MSASRRHLLGRLAVTELRVGEAVARRRAVDPDPDDGFRGLYLADHHVDALLDAADGAPLLDGDPAAALLAQVEAEADAAEQAGDDIRLRRLSRAFSLSPLDVDLLLAAAYPDLDARVEKLYGYLHDDVTQRRATVGLALELAGQDPTSAAARERLVPGSPLVDGVLLTVDGDAPFLRRVLRVPDRVTADLLGSDRPAASLRDLLVEPERAAPGVLAEALGRGLQASGALAYLRCRLGSDGRLTAVSALAAAGLGAVVLDLSRLPADADGAVQQARRAGREALLRGAGLVAGPVEALVLMGAHAVRAFAELPCRTVLLGTPSWDPAWSRRVAVLADAPVLTPQQRGGVWTAALGDRLDGSLDVTAATTPFRLSGEQIWRAAVAARQQADLLDAPVGMQHLALGARSQNAAGLERLARRIEPAVGWDDVVLPPATLTHLRDLASRARHRDTVLDDWQMRPGGGRGRGIAALFAGESGTGKTLSAEVIAGELGLDLYTVDLATVVDKYIGETEKNLERIFTEADGVQGVLLFDEADALFGKRSEVKDARDRYANVEVAYLLQRMESFNGLAILSTNLQSNLDEAFTRRLDAIVDFPTPDVEARRRLWDLCLGRRLPRADDVDVDLLGSAFELAGGGIRSSALTAAYAAAAAGRAVTMDDVVRAVQREYRKMGRLLPEADLGARHGAPPSRSLTLAAGGA